MGSFLDRFQPVPEFEDERWFFEAPKPFFKDACVQFAPYDPAFHKSKLGRHKPYLFDPSCPTALTPSEDLAVVIFEKLESAEELQKNGWEYLLANSEKVELRLRAKLEAIQKANVEMFVQEEMPGSRALANHWRRIVEAVPEPESAVDKFFKLVGISLAASGIGECCFVGFEFLSAWDQDHGLEIVMHKNRLLASGGMTELMSPHGSIVERIKACQEYEEDVDRLEVE